MADEVASLLVKITADGSKAIGELNRVSSGVTTLADKNTALLTRVNAIGGAASKVGGALIKTFGTATIAGLVASAKAAGQLNKELANIGTLSVPTERLKEFKGDIQDIAVATGKSTSDISEGMYQVISAFGDAPDTSKKVEINAKAATAGLATTADSIALTSAVTKAYGDTSAGAVQHVADLAFKTVELGQTTFPELAQSMQQVTSLSKELGVSQEELFGSYATLTGVTGNAAEVQTQMKAVYTALLKPSDNMQTAISRLGYSSGFAMIKTLGFAGTLNALKKATNGSEEQMLGLFNNVRAMPAVMALTGAQSDVFAEKLEKMENASGAATKAFEVQTEGVAKTSFTLEQAKVKMQVAAQNFGESAAPIIADFADFVDRAATKLSSMSDEERKAIINTGVLTAKIAVGLAVGGKALTTGAKLVGAIKGIGLTATTAASGIVGLAGACAGVTAVVTAPFAATVAGAKLAMVAIENYHQGLIASGDEALAQAKAYEEKSKAAYDMSKEAETVRQYSERYEELLGLLNSGTQTSESENERKEIEQWFIDNYGDYISAEEQKNGIHKETLDFINQLIAAQRERAEAEKEAEAAEFSKNRGEYRENAEKSAKELPKLQRDKAALEENIQSSQLLSEQLGILKAKYDTINATMTGEKRRQAIEQLRADNQDIFESYQRLTGVSLTFPELDTHIQNAAAALAEYRERLKGTNELIEGHTQATANYIEALKTFQDTATSNALKDTGYDTIQSLFDSGDKSAINSAIGSIVAQCKLLGATAEETSLQVGLFKNGFSNIKQALTSGDEAIKAVTAAANEYAHSLGLIPENKKIQINADGNITIIDEVKDKVDKLPNKHNTTITATDNTADGVRKAKNRLDEVQDKEVTLTVKTVQVKGVGADAPISKYGSTGVFVRKNARGTQSFSGGLALVNDDGRADPRELIVDGGRAFIPEGRDVVLPLSRGARVYTSKQTKAIMSGLGIPHYASGKNNSDAFTAARDDRSHYTKTHSVTTEQELRKWLEFQEKYKENEKDIADIEEQVFSLRQKLYNERVQASEKWLRHEEKYNGMSVSDYLAGIDRMKAYTAEYYAQGIINHKEYTEAIADLDEKYLDKVAEGKAAEYSAWKKDADAWQEMRSTYGDWDKYGDSEEAFLKRKIQRVKEMYEAGTIGFEEFIDDTNRYSMDLYKAQEGYVDDMLQKQRDYISDMREQFQKEEQALQDSWTVADRKADMSEVSAQLDIYAGSVTDRGQQKYKELQEQMKRLRRDEELYQLQARNNAAIEGLEADYKTLEENKKNILNDLRATDIDISGYVESLKENISKSSSKVEGLLSTLINKLDSFRIESNSMSDNRKITYNLSQLTPEQILEFCNFSVGN